MKPIAHLKIIDLGQRLPGPLACQYLSQLGAQVIKIENANFRDPFLNHFWYPALNKEKEILVLDFDHSRDQKKIKSLFEDADGIISSLPEKIEKQIGLTNIKFLRPAVKLHLKSSNSEKKGLHDLNVSATSGLLSYHLADKSKKRQAPPHLPQAGLIFAQKTVEEFLANYLFALKENKNIEKSIFLDQSILSTASILRPDDQTLELHNGKYPCYYLYPLADQGWLALACIEPHYWQEFCQAFELPFSPEERFSTETNVFDKIEKKFQGLTMSEAKSIWQNRHHCLTFF